MYIPNLHAATRILSHKIFGKKVKDQDDEFAYIRGKKLTVEQAAILDEFKMNLQHLHQHLPGPADHAGAHDPVQPLQGRSRPQGPEGHAGL